MSDFPSLTSIYGPRNILGGHNYNSPLAEVAASQGQGYNSTFAWPVANQAIYIPVIVNEIVTVRQMAVWNGATLGGNLDVGIYNEHQVRLVSMGSTVQAGVSLVQVFDIADTELVPGVYFFGMSTNSSTATYERVFCPAQPARVAGVCQQATAFALPATATFTAFTSNNIPLIVGILKSVF